MQDQYKYYNDFKPASQCKPIVRYLQQTYRTAYVSLITLELYITETPTLYSYDHNMMTMKTEKSHNADTGTVITFTQSRANDVTCSLARQTVSLGAKKHTPFWCHLVSTATLPGAVLCLPQESGPIPSGLEVAKSPAPQAVINTILLTSFFFCSSPNNHFSTSFVYSRILSTLYP